MHERISNLAYYILCIQVIHLNNLYSISMSTFVLEQIIWVHRVVLTSWSVCLYYICVVL